MKARRRFGIAIIILTLLLTIGAAYMFYTAFVVASFFNRVFNQKPHSTNIIVAVIIVSVVLLLLFYLGIRLVKKPEELKP